MREPIASDPVAERARVSPEQTALVDAADGRTSSYAALDEAVDAAAGRLAALGIDAGEHVGLLVDTGFRAVHVIYGALRLGAVPVPLNARLTAAELAPQVDRTDVAAVVCEPDFEATAVDAVRRAASDVPVATTGDPAVADATATDADDGSGSTATDDAATNTASAADATAAPDATADEVAFDALEPAPFDRADPTADDRRLLLCTSGTTGDPKAVELTAGNLRASAVASALRLGTEPDDRWFVPLSIYHMGGYAPIFRSILYGTTVVLQREFDAERTLEALTERDATCLSVVPTMLQRLLDAAGDESSRLADLRFVLSGGAATPPELVERCARRDVALCPTYGITEAASQVATARPEEARAHEGTVGRPLLPIGVQIVDDANRRVPRGETGEVVVDGPTISPGYYGDPDATADSRSDLGYHTGDLGYRDDGGRLWVLGRADDRIVTGGENVHAAEVATVLCEYGAVDDAVVLGLEDPEWGERVAALVAGDLSSPAAAREHCADRLAGYKRPRTVALVDDLPRTPSGTVDREAARERLREDGVDV